MKKTLLVLLSAMILLASISAQEDKEAPSLAGGPSYVVPVDPQVLGRGNATIAEPTAFGSFFYNPAGFSFNEEFNLINASPWVFSDMNTLDLLSGDPTAGTTEISPEDQQNIQEEIELWLADQDPEDMFTLLLEAGYNPGEIGKTEEEIVGFFTNLDEEDQIALAGIILSQPDAPDISIDGDYPPIYLDAGGNSGIYFTGAGFGAGVFVNAAANVEGPNLIQLGGDVNTTVSAHFGFALPIIPGDFLSLSVGAQAKGYIGIRIPSNKILQALLFSTEEDLAQTILETKGVQYVGSSIDVGAILDLWWFKFGLSAMDIFNVESETAGVSLLEFGEVGDEIDADSPVNFDPRLNFGVSFRPDLGGFNDFLDLGVHVDIKDMVELITVAGSDLPEDEIVRLTGRLINFGVEAELFRLINARVGIDGRFLTAGAGITLGPIDLSVSGLVGLSTEDLEEGTIDDDSFNEFGFAATVGLRF